MMTNKQELLTNKNIIKSQITKEDEKNKKIIKKLINHELFLIKKA